MICYQCHDEVAELSPRSRCLHCEHKRSVANEAENELLRSTLIKYNEVLKNLVQDVSEDLPRSVITLDLGDSVHHALVLLKEPLP